MSLSVEAMEYLAAKGLSLGEVIEFAKLVDQPKPRSANAERQARFRRKRRGEAEPVTEAVTDNVTRNALLPPIEYIHTPQPVSNETDLAAQPSAKTSKRNGEQTAKPAGVEDQVWSDFEKLRRKQNAPISPTALAGIEREATKAGLSMGDALRECVERNWRGFKAEWMDNGRQTQRPQSQAPPSMLASIQRQKETGACR